MSKKLSQSRTDALEEISNWTNDDVLRLLQKNGLEECCETIAKRQIGGDQLLHLTEGKLALWRGDLTRPLIWGLWALVEEVRRSPEKFVEEKFLESQVDDHSSDNDSWGSEFEDDGNEDSTEPETSTGQLKPGHGSDKTCLQEAAEKPKDGSTDIISGQEDEGNYANCGSLQNDESTYQNFQDLRILATKNASKLHGQVEKSLIDQLKDQLELMNTKKLATSPKLESLKARTIEDKQLNRSQPQKSFLYSAPAVPSQLRKRMDVPPPPEPKKNKNQTVITEKPKKPPRPPPILKNLDLVANLPAQTEESEDEYEIFDEQIIEQNQKEHMFRVDSNQSLTSGHRSSAESVYQPSVTSFEEEEYTYEIYESITETPDDNNYYLSPVQRTLSVNAPPPLPAKPPQSSASPSPILRRTTLERSPDKKSATLPHSNSNTSLSSERATRPLPPPPEKHSYVDKPWFHNVTREQATALITEQNYGNPQDGYFLLRPSVKNVNNPLALVLWYKDRVYNVPVRKRPDNRYALGSEKVNELCYCSVEEIVIFHMRKELILHSDGGELGSTKLTDTPPK